MSNPEHESVDGGFVCGIDGCEETRETPIGIKRHRATHPDNTDQSDGDGV